MQDDKESPNDMTSKQWKWKTFSGSTVWFFEISTFTSQEALILTTMMERKILLFVMLLEKYFLLLYHIMYCNL